MISHKPNDAISREKVTELFATMAEEAKGLWVPEKIKVVDSINSMIFLRDYVSRNVPVVIKNRCRHWSAIQKWNRKYLSDTVIDPITVARSKGNADCLKLVEDKLYFCLPFESKMTIAEFYSYNKQKDEVLYVQKQCSSLSEEMPELLNDISEMDWASEAFDAKPDATNIWIGDGDAISSLHKDPYENIYCVVTGQKTFTLLPPTDLPFLYRDVYPTAQFNLDLEIEIGDTSKLVPWIPVDPQNPDLDKYPLFKNASALTVTLEAGDVLYLPSLWYHKVIQQDGTIAVNFWYDMQFDSRWTWDLFANELLNHFKH